MTATDSPDTFTEVRPDSDDPVLGLLAGIATQEIRDLRYQVLPRNYGLLVRYEGRVSDIATAEEWFHALDTELTGRRVSQILWDSRPAKAHPPEVRKRIWEWLEEARVLKRSAILVDSEMLRLSANLSAVGGKVRIRAFHDFAEAEGWLRADPDA
ncbi:MAG: hypothetical protein AAGE52_11555 [Myxococcota bacterium]